MRKILFLVSLIVFSAVATAGAEDVTLPAAASIVGGAPFFSDVRAFNTSYTDALDVTAHYRCFITCTAVGAPEIQFTLNPRESRAFNDIVQNTFLAPNTAGGIEFEHSGSSEQLVVTSRLYSTAPEPTVGMFIPGLPNNEAHARTVLTSIRNGGFRTNVGAYNREDAPVTVTFTIFDGGVQVGTPVSVSISGHSGAQVNNIFRAAGQEGHATENAVITMPMPVARRAGGTTSLTIAITSAPEMPPNEPHTARDASNAAKLCDIPHATVPSTKPA